jgi:ArsR family transcriptional regulator
VGAGDAIAAISIEVDTLSNTSTPVNICSVRRPIAIMEDCCTPLAEAPLDAEEASSMASALGVLADPARLRLLSLLATCDEACVCNLTEPVGLSQPTVSHHLKVLTEAGLLERQQRGRWVFYRLRREPLRAVAEALDPVRSLSTAPAG